MFKLDPVRCPKENKDGTELTKIQSDVPEGWTADPEEMDHGDEWASNSPVGEN